MAHNIIMPQGGQDIEKGTVVRWLKHENDPVKKGEVVCEVETEKAVFEVQAPADGYLVKIIVPPGGETAILSTIGIIGELDEKVDVLQQEARIIEEISTQSSSVDLSQHEKQEELDSRENKIKISPKAKRIAQDMGIDYQFIIGTGPQGRIIEKDILDHSKKLEQKPSITLPVEKATVAGEKRIVQITKTRKVIARRMQQSKQTAPHFYVTVSVDMTEAIMFRAEFNNMLADPKEHGISVTDLVVKASSLALREFPALNSSVIGEDQVALWADINIGVAVATDEGLLVPVLEQADQLTLGQIAKNSRQLINAAREGKQTSFTPGRFTVSNLGMFGVENFIAIINPPETAILAVASVEKKVIPLEGFSFGVRDFMKLTLSVDHRAGDGVLAAKFLNRVKELLEHPKNLI